jgi:hypothetical protein
MVKIKNKVSACFCENIYYSEHLSWNPDFKKLFAAFRRLWLKSCSKAAFDSDAIVPKAACDITVHAGWFSKAGEGREARTDNFGAAFGIIFRIKECFQRSRKNLFN